MENDDEEVETTQESPPTTETTDNIENAGTGEEAETATAQAELLKR